MNSNKDFTGFTPEELAAEPQVAKEDPIDTGVFGLVVAEPDNVPCTESPENGQPNLSGVSSALVAGVKKLAKKHKKKASVVGNLPTSEVVYYDKQLIPNLKAVAEPSLQGTWADIIKADDIVGEQKAQQDVINAQMDAVNAANSGDFLTAADVKKAVEQLKNTSVKPSKGSYTSYIFPDTAITTTPGTVASYQPGTFFTYDWSLSNPQYEAYQKEISWLKTQLEEAKEVIKQLSGEPGEFIYIHPFDLYELLNSFVIPVVMNVNEEFSDKGYIEINGKKYKQSTMIPAKSKNFDNPKSLSTPGQSYLPPTNTNKW